jgi:hypothetical protein
MKLNRIFAASLFLTSVLTGTSAFAEHTRVTNPNALSVEFLGRGLMYSVDFDRVVNDDIVAGVGIGSTSMRNQDGTDPGVSTLLIPVYASYYFMRDQGSLYLTVGADIVSNSSAVNGLKTTYGNMTMNSNAVLPTFGLGYENRSDAGFIFRIAAYGIYASSLNPWGGLTLGYCF